MPDGSLRLDPTPDAVYTLTADHWNLPTKLLLDDSESPIPEQFENVVMWKALMKFAADEHDSHLLQTANADYQRLMWQMEQHQLPGRNFGAMGKGTSNIVVVPE